MNGLIEQWGSPTIIQDSGIEITYPLTFNNTPTVVATPKTASLDRDQRYMFQIYNILSNKFTVYMNTSKPNGITWNAIGY